MPRATSNPGKFMFEQLVRQIRPTLREIAFSRFQSAKAWLLEAVRTHPISIDLNSHGPSRFLQGSKTGTLFGFLGMVEGTDPVEELVMILDQMITYSETPSSRGLYSARITLPSKKDLADAPGLSPEWIKVSWPVLVEDGVSGLQYYLNKEWGLSVSGEGFQSNHPVRSAQFEPVGFLTPLTKEFRQRLLLK